MRAAREENVSEREIKLLDWRVAGIVSVVQIGGWVAGVVKSPVRRTFASDSVEVKSVKKHGDRRPGDEFIHSRFVVHGVVRVLGSGNTWTLISTCVFHVLFIWGITCVGLTHHGHVYDGMSNKLCSKEWMS